jgi:hypothetical protein
MDSMRRGSSTVVALVGDIDTGLLARLGRPPNVSALEPAAPGWEAALETFSQAGRLLTPYAVVAADPLGELAAEWRKMWSAGSTEHLFEERAGEAISAWRSGRLELPDYYLVLLNPPESPIEPDQPEPHKYDFHLGVLRSERPARVAEVISAEPSETAARALHALGGLRQGPWWPAMDLLVESIRSFFPGRLAAGTDSLVDVRLG